MSGWDWATYKDNSSGVDADFTRGIVFDENPQPPINGTLDAYESVEGVSGSRFNDILTGADTLAAERVPAAQGGTEGFTGSALDAEGIARVAGLQALLGAGITSFNAGEIILGGDGNDVIMGRDGDDIIDGDKWLNVRVSVRANADGTGAEIGTHNSLKTLVNAMFAGTINPGQLQMSPGDPDGQRRGRHRYGALPGRAGELPDRRHRRRQAHGHRRERQSARRHRHAEQHRAPAVRRRDAFPRSWNQRR